MDSQGSGLSTPFGSWNQTWKRLLLLGLLLNIVVVFTSDLGLDTHVHMARGAEEERTDEARLPWGHTRPIDPMSSDPSYAPIVEEGWFEILPNSETKTHFLGLGLMLILCATSYLVFWKFFGHLAAISTTALISVHPTFIFATGRVFPEVAMAILGLMMTLPILYHRIESSWKGAIMSGLFSVIVMAGILQIKGISLHFSIIYGSLIAGWHILDSVDRVRILTRSPKHVAIVSSIGIGGTVLLYGGLFGTGTIGVIGEYPERYAFALIIATLDAIGIYALFGMVLWPFLRVTIKNLGTIEDYTIATITGLIVGLSTVITIYIAALWTYEAALWNAKWPTVMWTMGNNGRYISMLMIPALLLIHLVAQVNPLCETQADPKSKKSALIIGVILILPISTLTAVHGQTMWTDDAGEAMVNLGLNEGEDFLFVSDATLGMHWLYTFRIEVDPDGENNIIGHWRASDSGWIEDLNRDNPLPNRGDLKNVQFIVLSPEIENIPDGWTTVEQGEAPWMNGGGTWRVLGQS